MPSQDHHRHERRLRIAETASFGARLVLVLMFGWGAFASRRTLADVEKTQGVLQAIERVRLEQMGARMRSRGFLLTRDSAEYLAARESQRVRDSAVAVISRLATPDGATDTRLDTLRLLLDSADALASGTRTTATFVDADSIRALLRAPGSTNLGQSIDSHLDALLSAERSRLHDMTTRQHRAIGLTLVAAGIGVVLVALLGLTTLRYRRRNTSEITAREATFRRLAEDNPDAVLVHVGYRIVYANAAAEAMLRVDGSPMVGRYVPDLVHPDDRALIERRTAHVSEERTPTQPLLIRYLRDDGVVCEAEARGAPISFGGASAILVVLRDLTARRDAERALQQSEQRFRAVLDAMDEGVVLHHDDLSIRLSNPAAERILGLTAEQLAGRTPSDEEWRTVDTVGMHLPPDEHFAAIALRTGRPASGVMGIDSPSRARVWISVNAIPLIHDGATTTAGVVVTFADITARRALEDQLRQGQKMEVMGRMASGVAHDFNNLLTVIRSASELLRLETQPASATFDALDDIESATDRAAALTTHLLTFSRRQHAAPALLQPSRMVQDALPILRRLAGGTVSIEHVIANDADTACIWADPVRFEQVLTNLVSNAKDAMPTGGTVRMHTGMVTLEESVIHRFGVIAPGRYVTLTVVDTGMGMSAEVLAHLFDPFYTTKPQGRGTGLGLSIVHGVVHEALGTITVESTVDEGSQLTVFWPRADSTSTAATVPSTSSESTPAQITPAGNRVTLHGVTAAAPTQTPAAVAESTARTVGTTSGDQRSLILVVDDEDSVRRVVAKQIEASGYAVITAEGGRSALAMLRNPALDIRLVVSDVRMPEMSGIELVRAMAAEQIDRPVLLVSGQMDAQLPRRWENDAIVRFLPKPLSGVALRHAIAELIELAPRAESTATEPTATERTAAMSRVVPYAI